MTQNGSAALERGGATLRELTHEPVEVLSGNSNLGLTRKERDRDIMLTKEKQLLWKCKYQPNRQKNLIFLIIKQMELFARDLAS